MMRFVHKDSVRNIKTEVIILQCSSYLSQRLHGVGLTDYMLKSWFSPVDPYVCVCVYAELLLFMEIMNQDTSDKKELHQGL